MQKFYGRINIWLKYIQFLKKTFAFQANVFFHAFMRVSLFTRCAINYRFCQHIKSKNTKSNFRGDIFRDFRKSVKIKPWALKNWPDRHSRRPARLRVKFIILNFSSINHICYLKVIFSIFWALLEPFLRTYFIYKSFKGSRKRVTILRFTSGN